MSYQTSSFIVNEAVKKILIQIPWGERSDFINDCILKATLTPKKVADNPTVPNPRNGKDQSDHTLTSPKSANYKTQSAQTETSAPNTSTKSQEKHAILNQL